MNNLTSIVVLLQLVLSLLSNQSTANNPAIQSLSSQAISMATVALNTGTETQSGASLGAAPLPVTSQDIEAEDTPTSTPLVNPTSTPVNNPTNTPTTTPIVNNPPTCNLNVSFGSGGIMGNVTSKGIPDGSVGYLLGSTTYPAMPNARVTIGGIQIDNNSGTTYWPTNSNWGQLSGYFWITYGSSTCSTNASN